MQPDFDRDGQDALFGPAFFANGFEANGFVFILEIVEERQVAGSAWRGGVLSIRLFKAVIGDDVVDLRSEARRSDRETPRKHVVFISTVLELEALAATSDFDNIVLLDLNYRQRKIILLAVLCFLIDLVHANRDQRRFAVGVRDLQLLPLPNLATTGCVLAA